MTLENLSRNETKIRYPSLFQILDNVDTNDLTHFPQPTWQRKSAIPVLQINTKIATQQIFAQNPSNKVVKNSLNKKNEEKNSRDTMISWKAALYEHGYTLNEKFSHIHSNPPSSPPSSQPFSDNPALEAAENSLNQLASKISSFLVNETTNLVPESRNFLKNLRNRIALTNSKIDLFKINQLV